MSRAVGLVALAALAGCGGREPSVTPPLPLAVAPDAAGDLREGALGAAIDAVIAKYHATGEFDGVVAVRRDNRLVYLAASGAGLHVDDVFPIASVTKQVTAVLVMQEVAAGHLALDATAATYLPELPSTLATVTLRQLLQHASGLPDPEAGTPEGAVPAFYLRTVGSTADEVQRCTAGPRLPAGQFHYNNCDYIVAGAVLERITGTPFAALVHDRIAAKLGLSSWGVFPGDASAAPPTVLGHDAEGNPAPTLNHGTFGAAGAMFSTATDLARWSQALLDHEVLDEAGLQIMLAPDRKLGGSGLGSWFYPLRVEGREPVTLIERQGDIAGVRILALASPSDHFTISILANTDRAQLFDTWTGKGMPVELVTAVAKAPRPPE